MARPGRVTLHFAPVARCAALTRAGAADGDPPGADGGQEGASMTTLVPAEGETVVTLTRARADACLPWGIEMDVASMRLLRDADVAEAYDVTAPAAVAAGDATAHAERWTFHRRGAPQRACEHSAQVVHFAPVTVHCEKGGVCAPPARACGAPARGLRESGGTPIG
eukprot:gene52058-63999_t